MRDFDIKTERNSELWIFGTKDDTIVIPCDAKADPSRSKFDIKLDKDMHKLGLPLRSEKIEVCAEGGEITVEGISFERLEIDAKDHIVLNLEDTTGPVDINMTGGEATLCIRAGFSFKTVISGKNNRIECDLPQDENSANIIELNGKDSCLKIVTV